MASKPNKCGAEDRNSAVKSWEADRAESKEGAAGRESKKRDPEVLVFEALPKGASYKVSWGTGDRKSSSGVKRTLTQ